MHFARGVTENVSGAGWRGTVYCMGCRSTGEESREMLGRLRYLRERLMRMRRLIPMLDSDSSSDCSIWNVYGVPPFPIGCWTWGPSALPPQCLMSHIS